MKARAAGDRVGETQVRVPAGNRHTKGIPEKRFSEEYVQLKVTNEGWCCAWDWHQWAAVSTSPKGQEREQFLEPRSCRGMRPASGHPAEKQGLQLLPSHWLKPGDELSGPKAQSRCGGQSDWEVGSSSHRPWGFSFCRTEFEQGLPWV